jgi:hypothetical protein
MPWLGNVESKDIVGRVSCAVKTEKICLSFPLAETLVWTLRLALNNIMRTLYAGDGLTIGGGRVGGYMQKRGLEEILKELQGIDVRGWLEWVWEWLEWQGLWYELGKRWK